MAAQLALEKNRSNEDDEEVEVEVAKPVTGAGEDPKINQV